MIGGTGRQPRRGSGNTTDYRRAFLRHVHQLLKLGYDRLTPADCRGEQEETITGFLVKAIEGVLDDRTKGWMKPFSIHEDPPVHDRLRKGKRRRKVDMRFDSSLSRPRSRFSFEAKRLGKQHPVGKYLGKDGIGCFLSGAYARNDDQAGMLGYVQSGTPQQWADKIRARLEKAPSRYSVSKDGGFRHVELVRGLDHTYRSEHDRPSVGSPISIYHTLFQFS